MSNSTLVSKGRILNATFHLSSSLAGGIAHIAKVPSESADRSTGKGSRKARHVTAEGWLSRQHPMCRASSKSHSWMKEINFRQRKRRGRGWMSNLECLKQSDFLSSCGLLERRAGGTPSLELLIQPLVAKGSGTALAFQQYIQLSHRCRDEINSGWLGYSTPLHVLWCRYEGLATPYHHTLRC